MWELLICHLCKGLLETPNILTCGHSACEKCLKELSKQKSKVFKCPTCCAVIQLPTTHNVFLSNVLDILKRESSACNGGNACDACSVRGVRNLRCVDCDMLLCTRCLHAHHDSVITRKNEHAQISMKNETSISLHEVQKELTRSMNTNETVSTRNEVDEHEVESTRNATAFARDHQVHMPLKCKRHPTEELRFFCSSCAKLICQECVIAEHIAHIFLSASDAAPSSKAQLSTLVNQTTVRILYLSEALRDTKESMEKLRRSAKDITDKICEHSQQNSEEKQHLLSALSGQKNGAENAVSENAQFTQFDKITNSKQESGVISNENHDLENQTPKANHCSSNDQSLELDPQRKALLNDLNRKVKRKFEVLGGHCRKLEMRLAIIENCQRFTTHLILHGSDVEVLMLENCIMENLGGLCQNTPEVPIECPEDAFVAISGWENLRSGVSGEEPRIIIGEGCCSSCFATGEGLTNAVVGLDCSFTVTVKNQQNKSCMEGRDSIIARVKTPSGGYFRAELIEHKLGKHKFRYRTYSAGPHLLRITLRGEEILGSPFETLSSGSTDYSRRGRLVSKFGRLGSNEGELCQPQGLAVDHISRIFVADTGNHRIQVFDESGRFLFEFGRRGSKPGEFNEPCDVTIARTAHVIVADRLNNRLQFFTPDGKFARQMQGGILRPTAVTTDQYNNIVVVDSDHSRVLVFTLGGKRLRSITWGSSANARLENVQDVTCNQTGETFLIYRIPSLDSGVTTATQETNASLVQVFDNNGAYIREFATPSYTRTKPNICRLVTDHDDRVLATGSGNKVQVFTRVGGHLTNITFTEKECSQIDISAIALSPRQAVVVADAINGRILVF